jgi:hypothetical protein
VNLFAALALLILAVIAAPFIIEACITTALAGTLIVASTTATASPVSTAPLSQPAQQAWNQILGSAYGDFPEGPNYPGDDVRRCPETEHRSLEKEKEVLCGKPSKYAKNECELGIIQERIANRNACISKRLEIMFTCFGGGDSVHWDQVKQQLNGLATCQTCLAKSLANQCPK